MKKYIKIPICEWKEYCHKRKANPTRMINAAIRAIILDEWDRRDGIPLTHGDECYIPTDIKEKLLWQEIRRYSKMMKNTEKIPLAFPKKDDTI